MLARQGREDASVAVTLHCAAADKALCCVKRCPVFIRSNPLDCDCKCFQTQPLPRRPSPLITHVRLLCSFFAQLRRRKVCDLFHENCLVLTAGAFHRRVLCRHFFFMSCYNKHLARESSVNPESCWVDAWRGWSFLINNKPVTSNRGVIGSAAVWELIEFFERVSKTPLAH